MSIIIGYEVPSKVELTFSCHLLKTSLFLNKLYHKLI
jgi:hypothetical protein